MPNCHWFGSIDDHAALLQDIIQQGDVDIYELYSDHDTPIRIFTNVDDILSEFNVPLDNGASKPQLLLNLWVCGSGHEPTITRFPLHGGLSWRERSGTLGFVQLYLERKVAGQIKHSQTNTTTAARMGAKDGIFTDEDGAKWDVRQTNRYSSKLKRMIRKRAVAKLGSISVLPGAAALWHKGERFGHHHSKAQTPDALAPLG
jgi:hypothetical protein